MSLIPLIVKHADPEYFQILVDSTVKICKTKQFLQTASASVGLRPQTPYRGFAPAVTGGLLPPDHLGYAPSKGKFLTPLLDVRSIAGWFASHSDSGQLVHAQDATIIKQLNLILIGERRCLEAIKMV